MSAAATTSRTDESLIRAIALRLLAAYVVLSARDPLSELRPGEPRGLPPVRDVRRVAHGQSPRRRARSARSSPSSSATSSASPRRPSSSIPRTCAPSCARTTTASARSSSGTAARSRSSSATRSWRCSARRPRTRTTPSAPCARRSRSATSRVEEGLELRVGITTGEALVSLDAQPVEGEGMASGDVVNTAARLQSAAPVNGILVDETTYRATRHAIDYRESARRSRRRARPSRSRSGRRSRPARASGRTSLDHVARRARRPRARARRRSETPSTARAHERSPQLVTLVGVPGIGKSRLVYELSRDRRRRAGAHRPGARAAASRTATASRSGRSPRSSRRRPASSRQTTTTTAAEKLRRAVDEIVGPGRRRAGSSSHLRPLVGLEDESELGGDRADRGLRRLAALPRGARRAAAARPRLRRSPLGRRGPARLRRRARRLGDRRAAARRLHGAARAARRDGRAGAAASSTPRRSRSRRCRTMQTARLHRAPSRPLAAPGRCPADAARARRRQPALRRAVRRSCTSSGARRRSCRFPRRCRASSARASTASRRGEGVPPRRGRRRARSSGRARSTRTTATRSRSLHALERKGFVRRQRRSSVDGEIELAFAHALVRDVAYGQIPRAERAARHREVAEWIESPRPHRGSRRDARVPLALGARARARSRRRHGRARGARRASLSVDAGDRAFALNAFGPPRRTTPRRSRSGRRGTGAGRAPVPAGAGTSCHRRRRAGGSARGGTRRPARDRRPRDRRPRRRRFSLERRGTAGAATRRNATSSEHRSSSPTRARRSAKARVLCLLARLRMLSSEGEEAIRIGTEALAMAEALDLDELRIHALTTIGSAKTLLDDTRRRGARARVELAKAVNSPLAAIVLNNLGVLADHRAASSFAPRSSSGQTLDLAQRLGDRENIRFSQRKPALRLDAAAAGTRRSRTPTASSRSARHRHTYMETAARETRAHVRFARGDAEGALRGREHGLALARAMGSPQRLIPALLDLGHALALLGRLDEARALRPRGDRAWPGQTPRWRPCSAGSRANPTGSA